LFIIKILAKDLISGLLTVNPIKRYRYENIIKHPWVRGEGVSS